jgi:hypothetical protein
MTDFDVFALEGPMAVDLGVFFLESMCVGIFSHKGELLTREEVRVKG